MQINNFPKQIIIEHYLNSDEAKMKLSIYEAIIISRLASYIGTGLKNNNSCWRKPKELARSCWMSDRQMQRCTKSLIDKKIIRVKRGKEYSIYSFDEFWFSEIIHYSCHLDAVQALIDKSKSACEPSNPPIRRNTPIYNNRNNNRPDSIDYTGGYKTHENGEPPEWVKERIKGSH